MVDLIVAMRYTVYKQATASCTVALYFVPEPQLAYSCWSPEPELCYLRVLTLIETGPESLTEGQRIKVSTHLL